MLNIVFMWLRLNASQSQGMDNKLSNFFIAVRLLMTGKQQSDKERK
jgi:hypothetical protein